MEKSMLLNQRTKPTVTQKHKTRKRRKALPPKLQSLKMSNLSDYREQLLIKFREFTRSQTCKNFKEALLTLVGRHTPVEYRDSYSFKQQWQMTNQKNYEDGYDISTAHTSTSIFRMSMFAFCMWGLSIGVFFPMHDNFWVKILLGFISLIEGIKYLVNFKHMGFNEKITQFIKQSIALAYSLLLLVFPHQFLMNSWISRLIATIIIIHMYIKLSKLYITIKNYHVSSQYRDIVNLFDLFVLLITITHIFGCVLFITAQLSAGEKNWVSKADLDDLGWGEKYIYSLYFSATTLLTVGYGDIAPTNVKEVAAILVTEFIGIAIFGYAVNKIGAALSNMQEKSQKLQKDLGTVQNFGKNCRLEPNVVCKMRTQVINNKRLDEDLCLKDENQLLQNFSEDLREKIQIESGLQVIKNSVFMIVNWTGKFQSKVAEKLVKQVYKAEEVLPQSFGKEKLYILDKGRIDILNCSKAAFQKVLKSFVVQANDEVVRENVYGYSSVISSRIINLNAIAKQTSICYTLAKADFLEILDQCEIDRQHFHQIKTKIDYSRIPEQLQTPSIVNIRQHYLPSLIHVITKYKRKKQSRNLREPVKRSKTRSKLYIKRQQFKNLHLKQQQSMPPSEVVIRQLQITRIENISHNAQQISFECGFECFKLFQKYFKKSNIDNIVHRMRMTKLNKKPSKNK